VLERYRLRKENNNMAYNGSGVFSIINTFVYDTVISETAMNANFSDIATGLSTAITKDGQTTILANIPFSSNKITGLGDGTAAQDAAALHQIQDQDGVWCGTAGGTDDALTVTPTPAVTAYVAGQKFSFVAASNNTGAATIAVSGLTTKAIQLDGSALAADDIVSGKIYDVVYDGTQFQLNRISSPESLTSSDIGVTVQAYDADTMVSDTTKRITANMGFTPVSDSSSSGSVTFDFSTGNIAKITLTEAITSITLSGATAGDCLEIWVTQAAGGYAVSGWPAAVKWAGGGTAPTISTTPGAVDIIMLRYDGTNYYGSIQQDHQ
jgi:hypothetical protein